MPAQEFIMNPPRTDRVRLFQANPGGIVSVLYNGTIIGSLNTRHEQTEGREFELEGSSLLFVRVVDDKFQVMHNGQNLFAIMPQTAITGQKTGDLIQRPAWGLFQFGQLFAIIGVILTPIAFFFLPYLGPLTARDTTLYIPHDSGRFQFLWGLPVIAGIVLVIVVVQLVRSQHLSFNESAARRGAIGTLLLPLAGLLYLLIQHGIDAQPLAPLASVNIAQFYGSGFWVSVVAMSVMIVGCIVSALKL